MNRLVLLPALLSPVLALAPRNRPIGLEGEGRAPAPARFVEIAGVQEFSGQLIVRPKRPAALRRIAPDASARARALVREFDQVKYVPQTDETILRVPATSSEEEVAATLLASGLFEYAEPDWIVYPTTVPPAAVAQSGASSLPPQPPASPSRASSCPNDPFFAQQWHHQADRLRTCQAWPLSTGSTAISVGVCDTGLRVTHEDLSQHRLEGYNAVDHLWESEGGSITPIYYHGTRVTGVVCATGDNGVGVSGVCQNLSHRMVRVSNQTDGGAQLSDLQHGARTSIENGDRVANVSYHGAYYTSNLTTASYIKSLGGLLVWAAGNTSSNYSFSDRDADDLIVVGATAQDDSLAWFSTYGRYVDLVAPGVAIYTTDSGADNDYAAPEGTSYAAPMVSGLCALIWSRRPELSPNDVERLLKQSCVDLGAPGIDDTFGHGRIDAFAAVARAGIEPPVADFAAPVTSGTGPLTVDFRDLSTGIPSSWSWDFGDGATSTEQNPTHTYPTSGAYTVALTVANAQGVDTTSVVDFVLVDVIPPVADFGATPTSGLSPLMVQFEDLSRGGPADSWLWDFGDGTTSILAAPSHTYTTSGHFDVQLTVTNAYGTDQLSRTGFIVTDFIPPLAEFSGTPLSGNSPLIVDFTDESTGGIATAWSWNFGDGWGSTLRHPTHVYTAAGTYNVRLTASNAYGSGELTKTAYVTVGPGPAVLVDFSGTPTTGSAPLTVQFTDESIGHVVGWTWEFDDGTSSNEQNPVHTFTQPGEYNIGLEVLDNLDDNYSTEKSAYIIVQ